MFINFPEVSGIIMQEKEVSLPRMVTVRQKYATQKIEDITVHIRREMEISRQRHSSFVASASLSPQAPAAFLISTRSPVPYVTYCSNGGLSHLSCLRWAATAAQQPKGRLKY